MLQCGVSLKRVGAFNAVNAHASMLSMTRTNHAFTLVELLTVIAIIGILSSLLLASMVGAKERAKRTACRNNLRQLIIAVHLYADEHDHYLPSGVTDDKQEFPPLVPTNTWKAFVHYAGNPRVIGCPNLPAPFTLGGFAMAPYGYVLGFNYLGGHDKLRESGLLSLRGWESPATINADSSLPLIADLNVWTPSGGQTVAPHGPSGAIYEPNDATNPTARGRSSRSIGAVGGNVGHLDGSVTWKNMRDMKEYQLSLTDNELIGAW